MIWGNPAAGRFGRLALVTVGSLIALMLPTAAWADATRDSQWHLTALGIVTAQQVSQGDGVTVAVVDSGVDSSHPDLVGSVLPGTDLTKNAADGRTDVFGHGTAMAGLIVAHGQNGKGALGIAPKAKILPVRCATSDATSLDAAVAIVAGIRYSIANGAKVINLSLGTLESSSLQAAIREAIAADIVVVAAVGNKPEAKVVAAPAAYDGVLAVAGTDQNGDHAAVSVSGNEAVISAPGQDIVSTGLGGAYDNSSGTSDSTAIVSGVVALIRSKYPKLSATQVIDVLTSTADDKGAPGRDNDFGFGIVNPVAALKAAGEVAGQSGQGQSSASAASSTAPGTASNGGLSAQRKLMVAGVVVVVLGTLVGLMVWLVIRIRRLRSGPPRPPAAGAGYWPPPGR